jgi:hypothetical protein
MNKGYFDESNKGWVIPIKDQRGRPLDIKKDKIHQARDKSNPSKKFSFKFRKLVWGQQTDVPEKVNFIAEILWRDGDISCWLCYYIFNRNGNWAFGQYGPMMPITDLKELYEYARQKGVL